LQRGAAQLCIHVSCKFNLTRLFLLPAAASYGDRAAEITRIAEQRKLGKRLVLGYPIREAAVNNPMGARLLHMLDEVPDAARGLIVWGSHH